MWRKGGQTMGTVVINTNSIIFAPDMEKGKFIEINYVNKDRYLNNGLILLDFWAEWCTACIAQDRVYEEIAGMFGDRLKIGKINVNDNRLLADEYGVRNIPYLMLLKDGKPVMQMPGIQSKEYLISQIKKHIQ